MEKIFAARVDTYEDEKVRSAVFSMLDKIDAAERLTAETKVLIKPNLLSAVKPDRAVTTNPAVLRAVIAWLRGRGVVDITLADSPGGTYNKQHLETVYSVCGLKELDCKLNREFGYQTVKTPAGLKTRQFDLIDPVLQADFIINVAKLKTHSMTLMSGGIKNLFGTIPGLRKPELHFSHPEPERFADMLLDLALTVKPDITLIDAINAMEGDGPSGGSVTRTGLLLASSDPFSLDMLASWCMGIEWRDVPMLKRAVERGLTKSEIPFPKDFDFEVKPFKMPSTVRIDFTEKVPKLFRGITVAAAGFFIRPFPYMDANKCIGCGRCAESCPAHVITVTDGKAKPSRKGCISCFCCQEMCPVQAISVKRRIKL